MVAIGSQGSCFRAMGFFRPVILAHTCSFAVSTRSADLFLLVVSIAAAATTADVSGLLTLSH